MNLVCLCLFSLVLFVAPGGTECSKNRTEIQGKCVHYGYQIEEGIRKFVFTARGKLPKDDKELIKYCKTGGNLLEQIKMFKSMECLSGVQNNIVNLMQPGIKRLMRIICETNREETLINLACLAENQRQRLTKCMNEFSSVQKFIADQNNLAPHLLMPQMCCNLSKLYECIWKHLNAKCRHPDADPRRYLHQLLQPILKSTLGYFCGKFDQKYCSNAEVIYSLQQRSYVGQAQEYLLLPIVRATSKLVL